MQQRAQGAGAFGGVHRLFQLAENLGFAQHHRVQSAGDTEGVLDRFVLRQSVEMRLDGLLFDVVVVRQPFDGLLRVVGVAVDFGAVAGGKNRRLFHRAVADQVVQRLFQGFSVEGDLFANCQGRGLVVDSEGE